MIPLERFVLGALGVWRITHLLNAEDGPGALVARLRRALGTGFWGELLDCFYCLSLWVAAPFAWGLAVGWEERLRLWLALSGAASLLERTQAPAVAHYVEERLRPERETGDGS